MLIITFSISKMSLPVCTLSPVCISDIFTDLPFSRVTLAVDGKQPPPPDGGGESKNECYCNILLVILRILLVL